MKHILITGAESYIGTSLEKWLSQSQFAGVYQVDTIGMRGEAWRKYKFFGYDTIFHVAGIAHADTGKVTEAQRKLYYHINCDLAVETAKKARAEGVKQFIYMSSILIYGDEISARKKRVITRDTKPSPSNFYGDSKWRAEKELETLHTGEFHVAILRPPMVYGEGCKGNYQILRKIALKAPIFPDFPNERSMIYIRDLCEFVRLLIESSEGGVFFPQGKEYVKTAAMVKLIAKMHDKKAYTLKALNGLVLLFSGGHGRIGKATNKAFGNLVYDKMLSDEQKWGPYQQHSLIEAILMTEAGGEDESHNN